MFPLTVNAVNMETFTVDDFFEEAHVGWNLGNSLDTTMTWDGKANTGIETRWGNPVVNQELIDYVQSKGFNVIRIPVSWYYHTYKTDDGNYIIYEEWLDRVQQVVDYAYSRGMYVLLNSHHDDKVIHAGVTDEADYESVKKVSRSFWTQIANRFKNYDEHLIFEAYNEVDNLQDSWVFGELAAEQINEMNQIFVDAVRGTGANNRYRLLAISPIVMKNSTQAINAVAVPTDTATNKIFLTVHSYVANEDEQLSTNFERIADDVKKKGLRVIVTEFGNTTSYDPIEHRAINDSNYVARAYEQGIICVIWDNGSDYALFNRKDLSKSNFELIDAVTKPTKYTNPNGHVTIDKIDDFYYKRLKSDGSFDDKNLPNWWGTWVNEELIPLNPDSDYLSISIYNRTETPLLNLHGVYYFDENKEFISSKVSNFPGFEYTKFSIPEGAKYFRYVVYNAKINTRLPYFTDAVNNGQLYVMYGDYKKGSLVGERVYFKEKPVEPTKQEEAHNDTEDVDSANQRNKKIEENPKTGVEAIPLFLVIVLLISSGLYFFVQKKYNRTFIKIK